MNKTVNINLAGTFFHIDEDAYLKLQRYLEAIKRSFTDSQGRSEIISDIEARIAELFNERVKHDKQVIGIKEVDEVIAIMGQPEDYLVDDDIFEDTPNSGTYKKTAPSKKLFRDTDNSYISGVSSGLGHYLGIDAVWMRLLWIILTIASGGTFIIIYILFWILVPAATTTAEKIMMTGEPVNISNIEKKIKDGFENVADTVSETAKNVSKSVSGAAKKGGTSIKSTSKNFFDTLADIIMFFFKLFAKFIGVLLILIGSLTIIALIIAWFSVGVADVLHIPGTNFINVANPGNTPIWLVSLFVFFAIGIPFFFLFYLGLKILINNLKSIGNIAKFTLLGLWLFSIIALVVIGIREASEHAFNERFVERQELNVMAADTLKISMAENQLFRNHYRSHSYKLANNENGDEMLYRKNIMFSVKPTTDSIAKISIEKSAEGSDYEKAINRAKNINYNYTLNNNALLLDSYLSTDPKNKFSDQEIILTLYLPIGSVIKLNDNVRSFLYHSSDVSSKYLNHYVTITEDGIICDGCEEEEDEETFEVNINTPSVNIDSKGVEIKGDASTLKIDSTGVKAESEKVKVNINSQGVSVKSED
ncbi:PspC domain-containing protein [Flavobacteriaceae bacterium XHP0103]|uniref:PspC domain-containing protein n=1 Tax=Marixanthotalea marina TaxID=2844359 RepID=UPI002989D8D8|nr:PspC domain-containing protein [Marixanthotalea marina]MBU3822836.1 PspC domain-containing protein [Marixanthotalea marina]